MGLFYWFSKVPANACFGTVWFGLKMARFEIATSEHLVFYFNCFNNTDRKEAHAS